MKLKNSPTPFEDLMLGRIKDLKEIEDRLERLLRVDWDYGRGWKKTLAEMRDVRQLVLDKLAHAEQDYADF